MFTPRFQNPSSKMAIDMNFEALEPYHRIIINIINSFAHWVSSLAHLACQHNIRYRGRNVIELLCYFIVTEISEIPIFLKRIIHLINSAYFDTAISCFPLSSSILFLLLYVLIQIGILPV